MTPAGPEVVVVGAGPAGLALVLALRRLDVDAIALDRGGGPTLYPKARVVTTRSMELLRRWGLADAVRSVALPGDWCERVVVAGSLAGPELLRVETPLGAAAGRGSRHLAQSPERAVLCTQDRLEAVLAAATSRVDPDAVRWRTEVVDLDVHPRGVTVGARREDGRPVRLAAAYCICADGIRGLGARAAVPGAGRRQVVMRQVSIRARIDLRRWTSDRPAFIYYIVRRGLSAQVQVVDGASDWIFSVLAERGEGADAYEGRRAADLLASIVGVESAHPAIADAVIRDVRVWDLAFRVADTFRAGPVLRVGDAAHETLPTGAMGMNLALADADALAWRLAAVVHGWGAPTILDQFADERRAAAVRTAAWTRGNLNAVARLVGAAARDDDEGFRAAGPPFAAYVDHTGLDLGPLFGVRAGEAPTFVEDGRPGSRAPHLALGAGRSTLDLYGSAPVLLVDEAESSAASCGRRASALAEVPLTVAALGETAAAGAWWSRHGVERDGAVLVRPDGYVWWRSGRSGERSVGELASALRSAAGYADRVVEAGVA